LGAISDRSGVDLDAIKRFLNINGTAEDTDLEEMLAEAKDLADQHCDNEFLDADDEEGPIPPRVERWIKATVARFYEIRENGKKSESVNGVGGVDYGDVDYSGLTWIPYL
jgi:hypothetical protein